MIFNFIFNFIFLSGAAGEFDSMIRRSLQFFSFLLVALSAAALSAQQPVAVEGRVLDMTGARVAGAIVTLRLQPAGSPVVVQTDDEGKFSAAVAPGTYQVLVSADSFNNAAQTIEVKADRTTPVEITLTPGRAVESIDIVGTQIIGTEEMAQRIPGSIEIIDQKMLESSRVTQFSEALRKSAGLNVREEEGLGLRPNVGIRGLNPTRSSKVLLLEDGVPLAYAPYGDNASYYHPPVDRFTSIEIMKGSGQILYGPVTVGGVINYVTPDPPKKTSGSVQLIGGNRGYFNGHATIGGTYGRTGLLLDYMRKQSDGSRENLHSALNDVNAKLTTSIGERHLITFKFNRYDEDSNLAYSGLRLAEWDADPRQNPFRNDFFRGVRYGTSINHSVAFDNGWLLSTNVYGSSFQRNWWRQSSNSGQRPNDAADPACGGMANLSTTCGNEGRLRGYYTFGVDPHLRANWNLGGMQNESDFGFRFHRENQDRLQKNGPLPTSRDGVLVESNVRRNEAYSLFFQNRFSWKRLTVTPGVRVERIFMDRTNRLANAGAGVSGNADLTQAVPGLGVSLAVNKNTTIFGGAHRGFAPPRTEDVISNTTGNVVDLDPELSWNYEFGFRTAPHRGIKVEGTWFRSDYENQIVAASLAGGVGSTLTNGGRTLHQGMELTARMDTGLLLGIKHNLYVRGAYTYLPISRFEGIRLSNIPGFSTTSVSGNRLPYSPENLLNLAFGYSHPRGVDLLMEGNYIGDQFGDDLNTVTSSADGQRGLLPGNTLWNATFNYHSEPLRSTFFVTVKNVFDRTVLVDRARGMLPGVPRLLQAGVKYSF